MEVHFPSIRRLKADVQKTMNKHQNDVACLMGRTMFTL